MKIRHRVSIGLLVAWLLGLVPAAAQGPDRTIPPGFYLGADLSYVNEMEDCGATYRVEDEVRDPYQIFSAYGTNLVRLRLWVDPTWTEYSTLEDVSRSMRRAQALGMAVLLDFHYSDTWADPAHQAIPAAWAAIDDLDALGQTLYAYTYAVLTGLDAQGLRPDMVQVGNEINTEILRPENTSGYPIDWERNAFLLNRAIQAVRDAGAESATPPRVILHIAKPEEVEGWLLAAERAGVTDYDLIGISYYPGWSSHTVTTTGNVVNQLRHKFGKDVMIVETAYPWTLDSAGDSANNILDRDFLSEDYPATPEGQLDFLLALTQSVLSNGGLGIVYWEPAWVSTPCQTLWGQGSHWENASFFDFHHANEILPAIDFYGAPYTYPVEVTLRFQFADGAAPPDVVYFWGDFTGLGRRLIRLSPQAGMATLQTRLLPGTPIRFQFYGETPANTNTALLPAACLDADGYANTTIPAQAVTLTATESSCPTPSN